MAVLLQRRESDRRQSYELDLAGVPWEVGEVRLRFDAADLDARVRVTFDDPAAVASQAMTVSVAQHLEAGESLLSQGIPVPAGFKGRLLIEPASGTAPTLHQATAVESDPSGTYKVPCKLLPAANGGDLRVLRIELPSSATFAAGLEIASPPGKPVTLTVLRQSSRGPASEHVLAQQLWLSSAAPTSGTETTSIRLPVPIAGSELAIAVPADSAAEIADVSAWVLPGYIYFSRPAERELEVALIPSDPSPQYSLPPGREAVPLVGALTHFSPAPQPAARALPPFAATFGHSVAYHWLALGLLLLASGAGLAKRERLRRS